MNNRKAVFFVYSGTYFVLRNMPFISPFNIIKVASMSLRITTTAETFTSKVSYDRNNLAFEFSDLTAGEYILQVSMTDSSSKEAINSDIKFTVTDTAATAITGEEVLGVVLIVVSVLMLGGVVTYFVLTRKKYKNY